MHYTESSSFLFVGATKISQFKKKVLKYPLRLENISRDFLGNNMNKNRMKWVCERFFVNYRAFDTSIIINIQKCLMKKHDIT